MINIVIGIDFAKETFGATILRVNKLSSKGRYEQFSNTPYPLLAVSTNRPGGLSALTSETTSLRMTPIPPADGRQRLEGESIKTERREKLPPSKSRKRPQRNLRREDEGRALRPCNL
jgi:hypothetical protein